MTQVQLSGQTLTETQIASYREHARKVLSGGYNLFAEMVLRVIASHDLLTLELRALRQTRSDREIEMEFIQRENDDLHTRIAELEQERNRLTLLLKKQQKELGVLKRGKIDLPPSWG